MKKLISIAKITITILLMSVVLLSCNKSEKDTLHQGDSSKSDIQGNTVKDNQDKTVKLEPVTDNLTDSKTDNNTNTNTDAAEGDSKEASYAPGEAILNADVYSRLVQIKDTVVELPCTISDLINAGFTISDDDITESYMVDANSSETVRMTIDNKKLSLSAYNIETSRKAIKDCYVYMLSDSTKDQILPEDNIIFFPSGIQLGSKMEDVFAKYGEGEDVTSALSKSIVYNWSQYPVKLNFSNFTSGTGIQMSIEFDRNTAEVISIRYTCDKFPISIDNVQMITETVGNLGGDKVTATFPYPNALYNEYGKNYSYYTTQVMEYDEKPYFIAIQVEYDTAWEFYHSMYDASFCQEKIAETLNSYGDSQKTFYKEYDTGYNLYGQLNSMPTSIAYRVEIHKDNAAGMDIFLGISSYDGTSVLPDELMQKVEALYQRTLDEIIVE